MKPPLLFLDIDGVLNGHNYDAQAESCTLDRACVDRLNIVLALTGAKIVVSSAWRYMVHRGAMTIRGFEHLLQTHGVYAKDRVIGVTREDESPDEPRVRQVLDWLHVNPEWREASAVVVLDDMDLGFTDHAFPLVRTDGKVGISDTNVDDLLIALGHPRRETRICPPARTNSVVHAWLRALARHPGWVALVLWWSGPVWVTAAVVGGEWRLWFAAIWTLIGFLMMCATTRPRWASESQT